MTSCCYTFPLILLSTSISMHTLLLSLLLLLWQHVAGLGLRAACIPTICLHRPWHCTCADHNMHHVADVKRSHAVSLTHPASALCAAGLFLLAVPAVRLQHVVLLARMVRVWHA
jgi:hypothetical protein